MSGVRSNATLTVDRNTTAAQLQEFAGKLDGNMQLRGAKIKDQNGVESYVLYAKSDKPGLWKRLTQNPRSDARAAVNMVLDNVQRDYGGKSLGNVRTALHGGLRSKDISADALKLLSVAADRSRHASDDAALANRGPGLDKLPGQPREAMIAAAREQLASISPGGEGEAARALADAFTAILSPHMGDPSLERLALSSGSRLLADIREPLTEKNAEFSSDQRYDVLRSAIQDLSLRLLPNRQDAATGEIRIGNETYAQDRKLGKGSFGDVFLYRCTSDTSKPDVAVKTFASGNADPSRATENLEKFKREANVHRTIMKQDQQTVLGQRDKVIGFGGGIRMADGTMAIALECARYGDAESAKTKIKNALAQGLIGPADAQAIRLTLIKDMAQGLAHLQRAPTEDKKVIHSDVKLLNTFIGEGGVGKIGDFGLTAKNSRLDLAANEQPGVAGQVSPEYHRLAVAQYKSPYMELSSGNADDRHLDVQSIFSGLNEQDRGTLAGDIESRDVVVRNRGAGGIEAKAIDAWALGHAAFQMIFDRPFANQFVAARVEHFGETQGDRAIDTSVLDGAAQKDWGQQKTGAFAGSTGDTALDNLLNRLLDPDPSTRLSVDVAASHAAFGQASVGSTQTRDLLVKIMTDDTAALQTRMAALAQAPQPAPPVQGGAPQPPAAAPTPAVPPQPQANGTTPPGGPVQPTQNAAVGQASPQQAPAPAPIPTAQSTTPQAALMQELQQRLQNRTMWG